MTPPLTRAQGRRFAWTLAAAFALFALVAYWRHRQASLAILGVLAALLFVAGVAIPTRLGPVERAWMALGKAMSRVTTPIFFSVVYFAIVTPVGWIRRTAARSPLARSRKVATLWVERAEQTPDELRRSLEHLY